MIIFGFDNFFYMLALIIGEQIHLHHVTVRSRFSLRLAVSSIILLGLSFAVPVFMELTLLNSLLRILLFALSVLAGHICYRDTFFHIVNKCLFGWLTLCCSVAWASFIRVFYPDENYKTAIYLIVFFVTYVTFLFFSVFNYRLRTRINLHTDVDTNAQRGAKRNFSFQVILIETASAFLFSFMGLYAAEVKRYPSEALILVIVYLCFGVLNTFSDDKRLREEHAILLQLREKERQQYCMSKEYMEIINVKSHDMKHLINALREKKTQDAAVNEELADIEHLVDEYDSIVNTNNEVLDIVLSEKARYCVKNGIQLTMLADGKALSFLQPMDIYSMVGNILDNAIEAVGKCLDAEKRMICFFVRREIGVAHIRSENYCTEKIRFSDGLPITTKEDRSSHGFGTKSIRLTAEKYNGYVRFSMSENFFIVDVLLPITDEMPDRKSDDTQTK